MKNEDKNFKRAFQGKRTRCRHSRSEACRGGIDPGDQCGYDTQGVAGPSQALSMGEGGGGGRGGQPCPMTRGSVESNYG